MLFYLTKKEAQIVRDALAILRNRSDLKSHRALLDDIDTLDKRLEVTAQVHRDTEELDVVTLPPRTEEQALTDDNQTMAEGIGKLKKMVTNLAQIVYTQNGNRHEDINELLDAARMLVPNEPVMDLHVGRAPQSKTLKHSIDGLPVFVDDPADLEGLPAFPCKDVPPPLSKKITPLPPEQPMPASYHLLRFLDAVRAGAGGMDGALKLYTNEEIIKALSNACWSYSPHNVLGELSAVFAQIAAQLDTTKG